MAANFYSAVSPRPLQGNGWLSSAPLLIDNLPKIKKIPKNTNGRLAIPAPAGLLVVFAITYLVECQPISTIFGTVTSE